MATKDTQCRKWLLTINNPADHNVDHDQIISIMSELKSVTYWCMADEIGLEDSTYHTHIFLYGKSAIRFSTIKKAFPMAHIDMGKGTCLQIKDYVTKSGKWANDKKSDTRVDGTFEEFGEMPVERQGQRNDLEDLYDMIKQGMTDYEILEQGAGYMLNLRDIERVRQAINAVKFSKEMRNLDVTYIWGDPGSGKTYSVLNEHGFENVYRVSDYNHPFDGYGGQDVILFDEFFSSLPVTLMNKCLEGYPFEMPCRFNNKWACYTKVYVIANIPLGGHYKDIHGSNELLWLAFVRRFNKILHYTDGKIIEEKPVVFKNGWRSVVTGERPNPKDIFAENGNGFKGSDGHRVDVIT
ncbi:MAG: replication protein [Lachnospiraceae bacterium]|nr:replication protein [Lachnospiraceae bacterium]